MLLRRVVDNMKNQNWTAVAIDFVIVVVGVFIGIQVSSWNDAREARAEEHSYLERLLDDMKASIARNEAQIDFMKRHSAYAGLVLEKLEQKMPLFWQPESWPWKMNSSQRDYLS